MNPSVLDWLLEQASRQGPAVVTLVAKFRDQELLGMVKTVLFVCAVVLGLYILMQMAKLASYLTVFALLLVAGFMCDEIVKPGSTVLSQLLLRLIRPPPEAEI